MNLALATPAFTASPVFGWLRTLGLSLAPAAKLATCQRRTVHAVVKSEFIQIENPHGAMIDCLTGSVWVTLDNDRRDVVLSNGQSFRVDRNQRVIVQALDDARVRVSDRA